MASPISSPKKIKIKLFQWTILYLKVTGDSSSKNTREEY